MVSFITIHDSQRAVAIILDVFVNGCLYRAFIGNHFPEESFDLFSRSVFIKVGKEDFLVGENGL